MHPAAATAATLVIFFAPGLWLVAALGGGRRPLRLLLVEQLFLIVTASLIVSSWVGLALAEWGVFTPGRLAAGVGILTAALAVLTRERLRLFPGPLRLEDLAVAGLLVFALVVYFPPFEYVLGGKDPGVYVNAGFRVARHGNLAYVDPLVRDLPAEARSLFFRDDPALPLWSQPRYQGYYLDSPASGQVVSHGFHLYPVWIGIAASLFGMKAGLYATPFFALFSIVGLFVAVRRLFSAQVAIWAAALLSVFQIQVWFARFPNTEMLVQFLFGVALLGIYFMEEERSALAGALTGAALGSTLLVRIDSVLFLVPLGLYLGGLQLMRRFGRAELACLAAFALAAGQAVLHAQLVSAPYVASVLGRWYWAPLGENLLPVAAVALATFILVDRLAARPVARLIGLLAEPRAGAGAAGLIFALAVYAYFIRPVWHHPRTAPHDAEAFLRMGWYLYPMGVALAVAGAMLLLARRERRWSFLLITGLTFSLFYFYKIRVSNDHFFCMRRFIPVILPSSFIAIAFFLATVGGFGGRLASRAGALVGLLAGLVYLNDGRPLWKHQEFRGSLEFIADVAQLIGDRDVVIFPRQEGLHLLELPLAELHGKQVLEFYTLRPDKAQLARLLASWPDPHGEVYFVTNYKISLSGLFTRQVKDFWFATEKYEFTYARPPRSAEPFHLRFTLSKAVDLQDLARRVPRLPRVDVGGSDDLQVAWFHEKESDGTVTYRWSQATSTVFLPAIERSSRELLLSLAGPEQTAAPLPRVRVALNDHALGEIEIGRSFGTYRLPLSPEALGSLAKELPVVRLDSEAWRPANVLPGAKDVRDLGVRVDWIEVR